MRLFWEIVENQHIYLLFIQKILAQGSLLPFLENKPFNVLNNYLNSLELT